MVFDSSMRCRSPGFLWFISLPLFHPSFLWQDLSLCSRDWPWTRDPPISGPQEVYGYALACLASLAHLRDGSPDLNAASFRFFSTITIVPVSQECDLRFAFCKLLCAVQYCSPQTRGCTPHLELTHAFLLSFLVLALTSPSLLTDPILFQLFFAYTVISHPWMQELITFSQRVHGTPAQF